MESNETPARPTRAKMRWSDRPTLAPDAASRQGLATRLALEAFESQCEAIAYLNTACGKLGGRPLDLAVESAEGLGRVERALADLKSAC